MKKKKVLLALIVVAIVASIGALGYLALSYFGSSARSSNAGGELSIDYLVSEEDVVEEETQSDSSKNIFQWLKERLSADKAQEEVTLQTDTSGPASTQSGMSQSIRQSEEAAEEDLTPIQQAAKDAQQTNTNKKKDAAEDDTPAPGGEHPAGAARGKGRQEESRGRASEGGRTQGLHLHPLRHGSGQGHESGLAVGGHRPVERHDSGENEGGISGGRHSLRRAVPHPRYL